MKKIILSITCIIIFATTLQAQKLMTRTGKVSFFSSTPIENIEAFNNEVACALDTKTGALLYIVPIKSFKFEKSLMRDHFNENYMESDTYPKATFKGEISNLEKVNFTKNGSYQVTTKGTLTIHGVAKAVTIPGTITVKGNQVTTYSKFTVKTADYDIKIPAITADKIAREIEVTVNSILETK